MDTVIITKFRMVENSAVVLLARIVGADGVPIVQSDASSLVLKCFALPVGTLITPSGGGGGYTGTTLTIADVILDSPPTGDPRWSDDTNPHNFEYEMDGSFFPSGDVTYQVQLRVTPVSGPGYTLIWQGVTTNTF